MSQPSVPNEGALRRDANDLRTLSILLDALVRQRCILCSAILLQPSNPLCLSCHRSLPWWRRVDGCPRCGSSPWRAPSHIDEHEGPGFEGCSRCLAEGSALHVCTALARYEGPLRRWIPGFKNTRSPFGPAIAIRLAIEYLANALARQVAMETRERPDLIVSVPLHPRRQRHRGFNHVEPIANQIAKSLEIPCAKGALERTQDTPSQARLVGRVRRENVRGAFRATTRLGRATRVWLVDDVLTTGSTLDAAADALLEAGCIEVRALTLAATLPDRRAPQKEATVHAAASDNRSSRID